MANNKLKTPAPCRDWGPFMGYVRWLAVPPEWTDAEAWAAFRERYKRPPAVVRRMGPHAGATLVGPVPK